MYEFEDGMRETSGFGGFYEENCREMVKTGLEWFDDHPDAAPMFSGWVGIFGLVEKDNDAAKELSHAVVASVNDCTGAMHHAVIAHVMHAHKVGWSEYVKDMKKG